ncbi:unnamed protein product [Peronospora belbahrii]|uniref:DNA replication regulator SLD2 n=1 Tax=Peronospora belbahrii TaxID=622444 RepID=A0AAU9L3F2_9STRA|nr:unnamed protein product [Peronospora belbahrii]CAH0515309.1 unnamed protein product [Peronospora belbahrii]
MESPDHRTDYVSGPYPEEVILEACNLEWQSIELRYKRLQKMRLQLLVAKKMEEENQRYQCQLRRLKRQEQEKEAREQEERQQEEARRCQREKEIMKQEKCEQEENLRRQRMQKRAEVEKKKMQKSQVAVSDMRMDEDVHARRSKKNDNTKKANVLKSKTQQTKQVKKTKPKRITPMSLPPLRPKNAESVAKESHNELDGDDSSPSELPDDGLADLLSLDKGSDSDADDEPSMVSLILPVAQDSPKLLSLEKKTSTPMKKFAKKRGGVALDFDFTNTEAKRQAKAAKAAWDKQDRSNDDDAEPEPMPDPSISDPKKRLKRRKEVAKDYQIRNGGNTLGGEKLMAATASRTIAVKPKKGTTSDEVTTETKVVRKKTIGNGTVSNGSLTTTMLKNVQLLAEAEGKTSSLSLKKIKNGKTETMSIKQRLANAELLAQMNKMQDMNTPKVLHKKTKKTQKQEVAKTLAAKRSEMRKVLSSGTEEADASRPDQMIEEGDLNISLNSSGLISDNDLPENIHGPTQKRPRAEEGDVTPTKKLQFLEITKRLVKSPMPRFLRTPTPLTSPLVPSAFVNSKAASPAPRAASARNTALNGYETRCMKSAPVGPKKTINPNRFGVPKGGNSVSAGGASFSMFDAFVNSGTSGAIPRLRTKAQGNV